MFVVLFLGIVLIACGGGSDSSDGGNSTPGTDEATGNCGPTGSKIASIQRDQLRRFTAGPEQVTDKTKTYIATIVTSKGDIVFEMVAADVPLTVNSFVFLSCHGFYDGLTFHRVVPEFVVQGGCPEGSGRGGPGYRFEDEPVQGEYTVGSVAMANAGPDTNGSQFFICIDDCRSKLTPNYNLFGHVVEGLDIAQQVEVGDVMKSVVVEERPKA